MPAKKKTSRPTKRRRPAQGGYVRGEDQKNRIIDAALRVFGEEGYQRASTRMIAQAAGIQPPALQYYFGGKEGLHLACFEHLIGRTTPLVSPALEAARATIRQGSPDDAVEALCDVVDALVDASVFLHEQPHLASFAARAQREDAPGAASMKASVSAPLYRVCTQLVGRATGMTRKMDVRMRTSLILAQVSTFHVHRDATLRNLGVSTFTPQVLALAKQIIRQHIRSALRPAAS